MRGIVGGLVFALDMIAIFSAASIAMAQQTQQASYWTLTVYLHAEFGESSVPVYAYGPFGAVKGGTFATGVGAHATLYLSSNDFPSGYTYEISIDYRNMFVTNSTGQDQIYTYEYNPYGNDNLTGPS